MTIVTLNIHYMFSFLLAEMHDMCMDGVKNGNSGYISSPQFPNMLVNGQEYDCSCKLMADSPTMLNVTAAKLKMEGNADGVCETAEEHKQVLDVKVGGAQHMSKQCISKYNEVLYSGEIQDGTPLELHFLSNLLREGGHFWINYEGMPTFIINMSQLMMTKVDHTSMIYL